VDLKIDQVASLFYWATTKGHFSGLGSLYQYTPDNCHLSYLLLGMNIARLQNATLVALALLLKKPKKKKNE
jgi:hypothetical protein